MRGTLVCGVNDSDDGRRALELAVALSERLGLRLVLAYISDGIAPVAGVGDGAESVSMKASREGAARLLARLAAEHGVANRAERRSGSGDAAALIGQIAAEEAADLIVVGSSLRGRLRRGLESRLGEQLASETPVPVLIAPPQARRPGKMAAWTEASANVGLMKRPLSVFWRVFAVNAGLLGVLAALLMLTPVEIDAPIRPV
jgi:nucleotide-binding universal stress UspA family protein